MGVPKSMGVPKGGLLRPFFLDIGRSYPVKIFQSSTFNTTTEIGGGLGNQPHRTLDLTDPNMGLTQDEIESLVREGGDVAGYSKPHTELESVASSLQKAVGYTDQHKVALNDITLFERMLNIKIVVFYRSNTGELEKYTNTGVPHHITVFLYLHDNHYFMIKNLNAFIGTPYACLTIVLRCIKSPRQVSNSHNVMLPNIVENVTDDTTSAAPNPNHTNVLQISVPIVTRYENGKHVANFVCAMTYDGEEFVAEGPDCVHRLIKKFRRPRYRNFTWIAHNASGFDNFILLEYFTRMGIAPKITMQGCHLIFMYDDAFKQRFIDSYSFIPMRLADTPEAFNLPNAEKGYFPHQFNRIENDSYVGPYPAKDFYGYATMSV
ncbi:putative DNA polymerase [Labeo rohita]|uniref:DNA-directed DNA polymerase n=1 Tax=Labeo rohita TaxID=84645 RepID=A0ABQ8L6M2_LABRO|nr:putative DNA polymerase [Labeo rohita]